MGDLEEFIRGLHAHDMDVQLYSINSIAQLGPSAASAIPELVALLDDEDEVIARLSLRALAYLGPAILPLKPRFAHLLQDPRRRDSPDGCLCPQRHGNLCGRHGSDPGANAE